MAFVFRLLRLFAIFKDTRRSTVLQTAVLTGLKICNDYSGWADAMAKVLRTKKDVDDAGKILLSKAKKDYQTNFKPTNAENKTETLPKNKMSTKVS
jgi:hypothetical protein